MLVGASNSEEGALATSAVIQYIYIYIFIERERKMTCLTVEWEILSH